MAGKCSRNGMRVDVRSYYSVGRPPAKFHRIRSPFDAPTDKYSGNSSRSNIGRFRSPKTVAGPLSLLSCRSTANHQANLPLFAQCIDPLRVSETYPNPTRAVVTDGSGSSPNIYKTSPFSYLGSLAYFSRPSDFDRRVHLAPNKKTLAI